MSNYYLTEYNYEQNLSPLYDVLGDLANEKDALALVKGAHICGYDIVTDGSKAWLTRDDDDDEEQKDLSLDDQIYWENVEQGKRWEEAKKRMVYD